ncbi:DUF5035 domain-containing protein [Bacteroides sp.]|uniref:DUF5035 domain-containing protein n=1 Tax=Bacteroides sp. TaxID=29523 RepID=UPI00260D05B0|nr:DUF5035 domain-containing protein [Bacteroides sp.]MDD3039651.1 DUF5035 domain-containing protein [Bacteroides sp.]
MKKKALFLLPLFFYACSDSGESPFIEIKKLYINVDPQAEEVVKEDYANRMDELPALKVGDKIEAFLSLDGNGAELKTFKLQNDVEVKTELHYNKTEVSTEGNLTDAEKGQLRFKDGVTKTSVMVQATVEKVESNGDVQLTFYLSSKAECEGAQEMIGLKIKEEKTQE